MILAAELVTELARMDGPASIFKRHGFEPFQEVFFVLVHGASLRCMTVPTRAQKSRLKGGWSVGGMAGYFAGGALGLAVPPEVDTPSS